MADSVPIKSDEELSELNARQLDILIGKLREMEDSGVNLVGDYKRMYDTAVKLRKEHAKINDELEKSDGILGGLSKRIGGLSQAMGGVQQIVEGGFFNPLKKLSEAWGKADQAAYDFGKHVGGNTKAVEQLRDQSIKFANEAHIGSKYNTTIDEMIKLQESYAKQVGRNLQLTNQQRETLVATSKVMGDKALDFSKKLENLGIGLERSGDLAAKMFNEASKSGISFEKYSASVTENLTKVQSYGFRNGVEGLTAMAKRAAEVNLSINEAFKVADKIQSGGIQEAIKMGANLQVLGGSFAGMGDPMGMLYQGLNDVEGLQNRMIDMFSGLGQIEKGQVKISGADRLRVNAAAQAMGVSSDEMFNMISRQAVRSNVEKQMGGRFNGDEELKELVLNTATLNKDNEAVVNINGKEKKVSEVNEADKQYLKDLQKSESEDIKDIANVLRGYTDVQSGFQKEVENRKAQMFQDVGKFTKGIYRRMGAANGKLTAISALFAAQVGMSALSNGVSGTSSFIKGIKNLFGKGGGVAAGGKGLKAATDASKAAKSAESVAEAASKTSTAAKGTETVFKNTHFTKGLTTGADEGLATATKAMPKFAEGTKIVSSTGKEFTVGSSGKLINAAGKNVTGNAATNVLKGAKAVNGAEIAKAASTVEKAAATTAKAGSAIGKAATVGGKVLSKAGGAVLGGGFAALTYAMDGSWKGSRTDKNKAVGGTVGATIGGLASLIPVIGPIAGIAGAMAGQWIGEKVGGAITRKQNRARSDARSRFAHQLGSTTEKGQDFKNLMGDYKEKELEAIKNALKDGKIEESELDKKLMKKLAKSGDNAIIEKYGSDEVKSKFSEQLEELNAKVEKGNVSMEKAEITATNVQFGEAVPVASSMAIGGKLSGPSDINGPGMPIKGSNIVVGGGEYVVNAEATKKNERLLDAINGGATIKFDKGGKIPVPINISNIEPSIEKNPMKPIKVKETQGSSMKPLISTPETKLEVSPIKLEVNGSIKLDCNGQQVDLDAIMKNPAFLTQLSQMIERRLSDNINGGNFKELRKNKQHNF